MERWNGGKMEWWNGVRKRDSLRFRVQLPVLPFDGLGHVDQVGTLRLRQRVDLQTQPLEFLVEALGDLRLWFPVGRHDILLAIKTE
jgi:hypothetical protein